MDPVAYLYVILVLLLVGLLTWSRIIRPALEDWGVLSWEDEEPAVTRYSPLPAQVSSVSARDYVTSVEPEVPDSPADPGLSDGLSAWSEAQRLAFDGLMLYRSREAAMRALVAAGWKVSDIRAAGLFRGDNAVVGQEVRAARLALGLEDDEAPKTPIAQRPIPAGVDFE